MKDVLKNILDVSTALHTVNRDPYRTGLYLNNKIAEELWEFEEELSLLENGSKAGADGVQGEAIDIFISAVDMYHLYLMKHFSPEKIETHFHKKVLFNFEENMKVNKSCQYNSLVLRKAFCKTGQVSRNVIEASLSVDNLSYKDFTEKNLFDALEELMLFSWNLFQLSPTKDDRQSEFSLIANKKINKWKEKRGI